MYRLSKILLATILLVADCSIYAEEIDPSPITEKEENSTIVYENVEVEVGRTLDISDLVQLGDALSVSNETVITCEEGIVTGITAGQSVITIFNGEQEVAEVNVKVIGRNAESTDESTVESSAIPFTVPSQPTESNAPVQSQEFEIRVGETVDLSEFLNLGESVILSDERIIRIEEGIVTAVQPGETVLSVMNAEEIVAIVNFTVIGDETQNEGYTEEEIMTFSQIATFSMDINDLQTKTVINKINLSTFESNGSFSFVDEEAEFINRNIKLQIISSDPETVVAVGDGYYTEYDHNISVYNIEAVQELSEGTYDLIINDGAVEKRYSSLIEYTNKLIISGVSFRKIGNAKQIQLTISGPITQDILNDLVVSVQSDSQETVVYNDLVNTANVNSSAINIDISDVVDAQTYQLTLGSKTDATKYLVTCDTVTIFNAQNIIQDSTEILGVTVVNKAKTTLKLQFVDTFKNTTQPVTVEVANMVYFDDEVQIGEDATALIELTYQGKPISMKDLCNKTNYLSFYVDDSYSYDMSLYYWIQEVSERIEVVEVLKNENTVSFTLFVPEIYQKLVNANDFTMKVEEIAVNEVVKEPVEGGIQISTSFQATEAMMDDNYAYLILSSDEEQISESVWISLSNIYVYLRTSHFNGENYFSHIMNQVQVHVQGDPKENLVVNLCDENGKIIKSKNLSPENVSDQGILIFDTSGLIHGNSYYVTVGDGDRIDDESYSAIYVDTPYAGQIDIYLNEIGDHTISFRMNLDSSSFGACTKEMLNDRITSIHLVNANEDTYSLADYLDVDSISVDDNIVTYQCLKKIPNVRYSYQNNGVECTYGPSRSTNVINSGNKYSVDTTADFESLTANLFKNNQIVKTNLSLQQKSDGYYYLKNEDLAGLEAGVYDIQFYIDGIFIGSGTYTKEAISGDYTIKFFDYSSYNRNQIEIDTLTADQMVNSQYARVNYQVDSDLYVYVRASYNEEHLSDNKYYLIDSNNTQSVTVRIQDTTVESVTIFFELMDSEGNSIVVEKELPCDFNEDQLKLIDVSAPTLVTNKTFVVGILANKPNLDAVMKVQKNGYSKDYELVSQGKNAEGNYIYRSTFLRDILVSYSSDLPTVVSFYVQNPADNQQSEVITKVIHTKTPNKVVFDTQYVNGKYSIVISSSHYLIEGFASENDIVTLKMNGDAEISVDVTADAQGFFSYDCTDLAEGTYTLSATSATYATPSDSVQLIVDKTAPVITDFVAVEQGNYNLLQWKCNESAYFNIYKNGIFIHKVEDKLNYLTSDSKDSRVKYGIEAVDAAGNKSEMLTITTGDFEPPTVPGNITMVSRASKSIELAWDASTDNVAVAGYRIYRNNQLIDTTTELTFTDTGLLPSTEYHYVIEAFDRADNCAKSEVMNFSTVVVTLKTELSLEESYYIEEDKDHVLRVEPNDEMNLDGAVYVYQYKRIDVQNYTDLPLTDLNTATINFSQMSEGTYLIRGAVIDRDQGYGESVVEVIVKHDDIAPEINLSSPTDSKPYNKTIEIRGRANDNIAVDYVNLYVQKPDGPKELLTSITDSAEHFEYVFDSSSYNGEITLIAQAYDVYGNTASDEVTIELDNEAPHAISGFTIQGSNEYITLNWNYEDVPEDFDCFAIYRSEDGTEFTQVGTINTRGYREGTADGIEVNQDYTYYVTAVDKLGNESTPSAALTAKIDKDVTDPEILSIVPASGSTILNRSTLTFSVYDNVALNELSISISTGDSNFTEVYTEPLNGIKHRIVEYTLDGTLDAGKVVFRIALSDENDNTLVKDFEYIIEAYDNVVKPGLSIEDGKLVISYSGNQNVVDYYAIYREDDLPVLITKRNQPGVVNETLLNHEHYYVEVVDIVGNTMRSDSVEFILEDYEVPVAVINPMKITAIVNEGISFDASASSDNIGIGSYHWDFGDGQTSNQKMIEHIYTTTGQYQVTLTVEDESGNSSTTTATVDVIEAYQADYAQFVVSVFSRLDNSYVENAVVSFVNEDEETVIHFRTSEPQKVILEPGVYSVTISADGYFNSTKKTTIALDTTEVDYYLGEADFVTTELSATELTYDEMIALGIDVHDPANQHVYKYEIKLQFRPEVGLAFEIPITTFKNEREYLGILGDGTIIRDGIGFTCGNYSGKIYGLSERFFLVITGETKWLKQAYDVQLVVANNSQAEDIYEAVATLQLPDGLSYAVMVDGQTNESELNMGTILSQESKTGHWYIVGDKAGDYGLKGTLEAYVNGEYFYKTFETAEDIHVLDPNTAISMDIYVNDKAYMDKDYTVTIKFTNNTSIPIYGFSYSIDTIDQYEVFQHVSGEQSYIHYSHEDFEGKFDGMEIEEFGPGDTVQIDVETNIMFRSVLEAIKKVPDLTKLGGFQTEAQVAKVILKTLDIRYVIEKMTVSALEGSTVDLNPTIHVNEVDIPSIYEWVTDEIFEEYKSKLIDFFDKEFFPGYKQSLDYGKSAITLDTLLEETKDYDYIVDNGGMVFEVAETVLVPWKKDIQKASKVFRVIAGQALSTIRIKVIDQSEAESIMFGESGRFSLFSQNRSVPQLATVQIESEDAGFQKIDENSYEVTGTANVVITGLTSGECYIYYQTEEGFDFIQKITVITEEDAIETVTNTTISSSEGVAQVEETQVNELLEELKNQAVITEENNPDYPVASTIALHSTDANTIQVPMSLIHGLAEMNMPELVIYSDSGTITLPTGVVTELSNTQQGKQSLTISLIKELLPVEGYENANTYQFSIRVDGKAVTLQEEAIEVEIDEVYDCLKYKMDLVNIATGEIINYIYSDNQIKTSLNAGTHLAVQLTEIVQPTPEQPSQPSSPSTPEVNAGTNQSGQSIRYPSVIQQSSQNDEQPQDLWKIVADELMISDKVIVEEDITSIPVEILQMIREYDRTVIVRLSDGTTVTITSEDVENLDWDDQDSIALDQFVKEEQKEPAPSEEPVQDENECNLCHHCSEPLGLCIWIWIILAIAVVTILVFIIIKRKNDQVETDR